MPVSVRAETRQKNINTCAKCLLAPFVERSHPVVTRERNAPTENLVTMFRQFSLFNDIYISVLIPVKHHLT
jgi:hypothetical protein